MRWRSSGRRAWSLTNWKWAAASISRPACLPHDAARGWERRSPQNELGRRAVPMDKSVQFVCLEARWRGAPKDRDNGRYQDGLFTCEAMKRHREIRVLIAQMQAFADDL